MSSDRCDAAVLRAFREVGALTLFNLKERLRLPFERIAESVHSLEQKGFVEVVGHDNTHGEVYRAVVSPVDSSADPMEAYKLLLRNWREILSVEGSSFVGGRGNLLSKIVIIGSHPGNAEEVSKMPFTGASGSLLLKHMRSAGLDLGPQGNTFAFNRVFTRPTDIIGSTEVTVPPSVAQIRESQPLVEALLSLINPRLVIFVGSASDQVFNLSSTRVGFPIFYKGRTFLRVTDMRSSDPASPTFAKDIPRIRAEWTTVKSEFDKVAYSNASKLGMSWRLPIRIDR